MTERGRESQVPTLSVQLREGGEALTERVAELVDGLDLVVARLEQGRGRVRVTLQGELDPLIEVGVRALTVAHVQALTHRGGAGRVPSLEGDACAVEWANVLWREGAVRV